MNSQIMQEIGGPDGESTKAAIGIGETLPLFELPQIQKRSRQQPSRLQIGPGPGKGKAPDGGRSVNPGAKRLATVRHPRAVADGDRHMHVAWQLSKALKAVKTGRKTGREMAKLTANQRHQVGNAICEHLLASLRQQVHSESRTEHTHHKA